MVIEHLVRNMTTATLLSYGEIYNILREELNNKMVDLIKEYDKAECRIKDTADIDYELININTMKIENIQYSWCSPQTKGDWCGWIKTGFVNK